MSEGREWMYQRIDKRTGELDLRFWEGLKQFLTVAFRDSESRGWDTVRCPCIKCKNGNFYVKNIVENHLCEFGFKPDYYVWDCHGETSRITRLYIYDDFSVVNNEPSSSNWPNASIENELTYDYQTSDVQQMVREGLEFRYNTLEHENVENDHDDDNDNDDHDQYHDEDNDNDDDDQYHDEDNDNDADYNPEMDEGDGNEDRDEMESETPNLNAQRYYACIEAASQPLYNQCRPQHKKLSVLAKFLSVKNNHNISDAGWDGMMKVVNEILPGENNLPASTDEAKKVISGLALPYIKIHACENNCMLFYGVFRHLEYCGMCNLARYKENGVNKFGQPKRKPKKVLRYLPITERLRRLYHSSKTAVFMSYHVRANANANDVIGHPSHSRAWKHVNECYPDFAAEDGNVRLGLCTDGFNPLHDSGSTYSMWPVFITVYNLPPDLCMKQPFIYLALLIPGPKSPGRNIDVFLRPLIDELSFLWNTGIDTWDAHRRKNFRMRACLIWTISDFPAYGMLSGWSTHGKLACPYCMIDVDSFKLQNGGKPCWWGCHRRFLSRRHRYRKDTKTWKEREHRDFRYKSGLEILAEINEIQFSPFGSMWDKERPPGYGTSHNWTKKSIFWELPYWPYLLLRHNLDVMHIEKNCFDNIFCTVMNQGAKSKDNFKSRLDLAVLGMRSELHLFSGRDGNPCKPKAIYCLNREQVANVCTWLKNTLKLPDGYASNIGHSVNSSNNTFYSMKTHDCHVFMQKMLPIVLRGNLPDDVWVPIVEFSKFFRILCAREFRLDDIEEVDEFIVVTLCKLEMIFPPSLFDSMEHLTVQLPWQLRTSGSVQFTWMYGFERCMKTLKQKCTNKQHKEGSIIEKYLLQEISYFADHYDHQNLGTPVNPLIRNEVYDASFAENSVSIFKHPVRTFEELRNRSLTEKEVHYVHMYILMNCSEVEPYISQFKKLSCSRYPVLVTDGLDKYRHKHFAAWFKNYANANRERLSPQLYDLACGPHSTAKSWGGAFVNGFRFHAKDVGRERTTANWGVCVFGDTNTEDYVDYYGCINEILMLRYNNSKLTVFKGTWFDPYNGVHTDKHSGITDIDYKSRLKEYDPFILASQAQQVAYIEYPSKHRDLKKRWSVFKMKPRHFKGGTKQIIDVDPVQEAQILDTIVLGDNDLNMSLVDVEAEPERLCVE